ncbi:MAG: mandelate racemase/muconate lactonizing enzyme family protein [Promethearchaeota archaeon]
MEWERDGPKVVRVELTPLFVPFKENVVQLMSEAEGGLGMKIPAEEAWLGGEFVVCRLFSDDGHEGASEVFVWLPETGVTASQVVEVAQRGLCKYLLGRSPFEVERLRAKMNRNVARSEVAKGLLDAACYDLAGRVAGLPVHALLGGAQVDRVPLAALVPLADSETMVSLAEAFHAKGRGNRTLRLKLGNGPREDEAIVAAVRDALGPGARLRVDYNQAYAPAEAVRAIRAIEPHGIDVAEQPVRADDYLGMAWIQRRVDVPLMAHEACFSLRDLVVLDQLGAIGCVGVNTERPGGLTDAVRAISYAEARGMGVVVHNQTLGLATAAQVHLAAAKHDSLGHDPELFGHVMFEDDLVERPLKYAGGAVEVPRGPGWGDGVRVDEEALESYRTGPTVVVKWNGGGT